MARFWQRSPAIMHRIWAAAALAVAAACTSSDPSPTPERSPLRSCAGDDECRRGEWCREGLCRSWEPDMAIGLPTCPNGCPATQVCADGRCVGHVAPDASAEHP